MVSLHNIQIHIAFMLPLRTIDAAHEHTYTHRDRAAEPYSSSHVDVAAKAADAELDKFMSIIPVHCGSTQDTFIQSSVAIQTSRKNSILRSRKIKLSFKLKTLLTSTDRKIHRHILRQIVQLDCV